MRTAAAAVSFSADNGKEIRKRMSNGLVLTKDQVRLLLSMVASAVQQICDK